MLVLELATAKPRVDTLAVARHCAAPVEPRSSQIPLRTVLVVLIALTVAVFWTPLRFSSLMGDDFLPQILVGGAQKEGWFYTTTLRNALNIFRPLSLLFIIGRASLFGPQYDLYFYTNLMIFIATGVGFFFVLTRNNRPALVAAALVLLLLFNHSQYYLALIATGEVDLLSNSIFLVLLAILVRYLEHPSTPAFLWIAVTYVVLLLTRENYLFASPILVLAAFWRADGHTRTSFVATLKERRRWLLAALPILSAIAYLIGRRLVMGAETMTVPGAKIELSVVAIARSFGIFFLDVFGVYLNESHFIGLQWQDTPLWLRSLQIFWAAIWIVGLVVYLAVLKIPTAVRQRALIVALLAVAMLIPSSLIHKHDAKYVIASLMAAFVVTGDALLLLRSAARTALACIAIGVVALTTWFYKNHLVDAYYVRGSVIAQRAKALTFDRFGLSLRDYQLYFPNADYLDWPLLYGKLFNVYLGDEAYASSRYASLEEIDFERPKLIVLATGRDGLLVDVTDSERSKRTRARSLRWSGVDSFSEGAVTPATHDSQTPTGAGAYVGTIADRSLDEAPEPSLIVLSGFHWLSKAINVSPSEQLAIAYKIPFEESDGAVLRVSIVDALGKSHEVLTDQIAVESTWRHQRVNLDAFAGQAVRVDVEVRSDGGSIDADWLTIKELDLVSIQR